MNDTPVLARFYIGFQEAGVGVDGMPLYEEIEKVILSRPPLLEVTRIVTDEEREDYAEPYKLFLKERAGKELRGAEGYPLAMWVAINEGDLKMCLARDIYTVEDLAKYANRKPEQVPAQIIALAQRAKKMVELQKSTGRHEAKISELEGQIGALREQNNEFRAQLDAANTLIATLKARAAA